MSIRETYHRGYRIWCAPTYRNLVATIWPRDSLLPLEKPVTATLDEGEEMLLERARAYIDASELAARSRSRAGATERSPELLRLGVSTAGTPGRPLRQRSVQAI
jgi:hypothetical protein